MFGPFNGKSRMFEFENFDFGPYWTMAKDSLRKIMGEQDFWERAAGSHVMEGRKASGSHEVQLGRFGTGPFVVNEVSGAAGKSTSLLRGVLQTLLQQNLLILKGGKVQQRRKQKHMHVDVVGLAHLALKNLATGHSEVMHGVDTVFVAVDLSNTAHFIGNRTYVQSLLNSPNDLRRLQGLLGEDVQLQPLEISNAKLIGPLMDDLISKGWLSKRAAAQHKRQQGT